MKYKLIATDMDGTLLNEKSELSNENKEAIIKAQENGTIFCLASGRPTAAMKEFSKILKLDKFGGYIISYNGAMIYDCKNNKVIFSEGLNKEQIKKVFEYAKINDVAAITYVDDLIYCSKFDEYVNIETTSTKMETKTIDNLENLDYTKTLKCMIVAKPEKIKELFEDFDKENEFFTAISNPHFLEIANSNIDKGKALRNLSSILGLNKEEVIACGDSFNDVAMLEFAGLSVAADNSHDKIKEICSYVSKNNNEHILEDVIKKYVLNY